MKKVLLLLAILLCGHSFSQSYKFNISGKIQSEKDKTPIEAATIHLEKVSDSTVISYTISNDKGNFSLEGKSFNKDVKLYVSFIGMDSYSKRISLTKNPSIKLGTISLKEESNVLDEVVIKSRAPITIKKDTLEFNVKSFKTKKNANVEDLLKKLPGVEVDENGKITVNGKEVNKILVNGKPFFGNDPTITTKNLSKDIIEKIQVTDTKSKSEAFSGEKGDANNKTINLTIKKENNKGWFGRVSAGGGTDKRYEAATMINRFNNNTRFSALASTNNINSPGFSFGEIQKMYGGNGGVWFGGNGSFGIGNRRFGGGQGIVTSKIAGATYADEYKKGLDVNANYIFSNSNSVNDSRQNREYTLPDRRYFSNIISSSDTNNDNHNIDAELDIEIDSTLLINVQPRFIYNNRESSNRRNEESLDENNTLTNQFTSNTISKQDNKNFENNIDITKKFGSKGAFIKASLTNQIDQTNGEDFNNSTINIFGTNPTTEIRNQKSNIDNDLNSISSRFSYRLPLISQKLFIDAKYRYSRNERKNRESTFDFNNTTQDFTDFNTTLSSDFTYNDITKTPSLGIVYTLKKSRFNLEVGQVRRTLENIDRLRPNLSLEKDFNNLRLTSSFRYRFDSKASIYFDYNLDNDAPNVIQLQPFSDVTNPSNIITGNPNLKPSQSHRLYVNFNKYNWQKRTGFFSYFGGTLNTNQIVTKTTINDQLVRNTTYDNADGGYNFWGGASYNKSIKIDSLTSVDVRMGIRLNGNRNISFLNDVENTATSNSITPRLGLAIKWNKVITIEPTYNIDFTKTTYSANSFQDQNFARHNLRIRTRTNLPKKLEWRNDIRYTFNPNVIGFNKSAWFWNATLAYSVLKDKGTITFKAYDILSQNNNAQRRAVNNYIEDSESTILQQYFMVGFSWKFNSLGKKGKIREYDFSY
ncbi:outer membrane beta-barrel protein [Tenacibaculum amylolyticum]|uniref:outer membrane beta-barrel protein n=1 Tax=Tenacibaculum amylolyticum TaxID=104269 RepID=UPI00389556B2